MEYKNINIYQQDYSKCQFKIGILFSILSPISMLLKLIRVDIRDYKQVKQRLNRQLL